MEEREVTLRLSYYLKQKEWEIKSIHFPGAQGGLSISVKGKTRGWVPDLVAIKNHVVLTVESKTDYSQDDVDKLDQIYKDKRYLEKLGSKLCLSSDIFFQKAIAFCSVGFSKECIPDDFVVFTIRGKNEVAIFFDKYVDEKVKTILSS